MNNSITIDRTTVNNAPLSREQQIRAAVSRCKHVDSVRLAEAFLIGEANNEASLFNQIDAFVITGVRRAYVNREGAC